jgi:hypothetical protein
VFYFSFVTTNVTEVAFWLLYRVCQKGRINFLVHSKYSVILDIFKFAASSGAKMVAIAVLYISRDFSSARTVAPSSAKIGSLSETFSQCFFNEMNRPVIIQQVVISSYKN